MSIEADQKDEGPTPRDIKLLHLSLASLGVPNYSKQVPLQLLTFAHRYIHQTLQDAQAYADHSRGLNSSITIDDARLAIASVVNQSFRGPPPKEFLLELAANRNKSPLPPVHRASGIRLPAEKYCMTQPNWIVLPNDFVVADAVNEQMNVDEKI